MDENIYLINPNTVYECVCLKINTEVAPEQISEVGYMFCCELRAVFIWCKVSIRGFSSEHRFLDNWQSKGR